MSDQQNSADIIWRIELSEAVDAAFVESAVSEASRIANAEAMQGDVIAVHRLDLSADRTILFVSANDAGKDAIVKALAITCEKAKPRARRAKLEELTSPT